MRLCMRAHIFDAHTHSTPPTPERRANMRMVYLFRHAPRNSISIRVSAEHTHTHTQTLCQIHPPASGPRHRHIHKRPRTPTRTHGAEKEPKQTVKLMQLKCIYGAQGEAARFAAAAQTSAHHLPRWATASARFVCVSVCAYRVYICARRTRVDDNKLRWKLPFI